LALVLARGFTIFVFEKTEDDEDLNTFDGSIMSWTLLSFAVITPINAAIRMSFTRREQGLHLIATIRSTFLEIYTAHAIWDWGKESGRQKSDVDWLEHSDEIRKQIVGICSELTRFLTLPNVTRAWHKMTILGKREAKQIEAVRIRLHESIVYRMGRLSVLCEVLKREGLPPNEVRCFQRMGRAFLPVRSLNPISNYPLVFFIVIFSQATRIRQWERIVLEAIEKLRTIKLYRTPQGLRSFCRLFSVLLPPFYAPYYAQLAHDVNSLGVAIVFSILTSIALTALFETVNQMEDPFLPSSILDGVDVTKELLDNLQPEFLNLRVQFFPNAASSSSSKDDDNRKSPAS